MVQIPEDLIEDIYYHLECHGRAGSSESNKAFHYIELNNKVSDLASWHSGYSIDTGTMPYEREDQP